MGALADFNLAATPTINVTKRKGDEQGGTRGSKQERRVAHELRQVYESHNIMKKQLNFLLFLLPATQFSISR